MNRKEPRNTPNSAEDVWRSALGHMCSGLDKYGPGEILNLLVTNSHRDEIGQFFLKIADFSKLT